jgi:hypothetical protein
MVKSGKMKNKIIIALIKAACTTAVILMVGALASMIQSWDIELPYRMTYWQYCTSFAIFYVFYSGAKFLTDLSITLGDD